MAKKSYEQKKRDLASKGMPDPRVGKNVTKGDKKAALGYMGDCAACKAGKPHSKHTMFA